MQFYVVLVLSVWRYSQGEVVNFVTPPSSIHSCFHWYKKCTNPPRNVGVMVQNKVAWHVFYALCVLAASLFRVA